MFFIPQKARFRGRWDMMYDNVIMLYSSMKSLVYDESFEMDGTHCEENFGKKGW